MAEYKFKRTGAQMDALFDEVAEGGKIYQTTLPIREIIESTFTSIRASDELELTNIVNKAKEGYLILVPPGMVDFGYAGHLQSLSIEINGQILVNYEQGGSLDLSFLVSGKGEVYSVNISTNDPVETNPWIVSVKEIGGSGSGSSAEVYKTSFNPSYITNDSIVTQEQVDELTKILAAWETRKIVILRDLGDNVFNYGILSGHLRADNTLLCLTLYDDNDNLCSYECDLDAGFDGANAWTLKRIPTKIDKVIENIATIESSKIVKLIIPVNHYNEWNIFTANIRFLSGSTEIHSRISTPIFMSSKSNGVTVMAKLENSPFTVYPIEITTTNSAITMQLFANITLDKIEVEGASITRI